MQLTKSEQAIIKKVKKAYRGQPLTVLALAMSLVLFVGLGFYTITTIIQCLHEYGLAASDFMEVFTESEHPSGIPIARLFTGTIIFTTLLVVGVQQLTILVGILTRKKEQKLLLQLVEELQERSITVKNEED